MPVPTDITAGTLTITNGSTAVIGTGTAWLASDLRQGDVILWIEGGDGFQTPILADVPSSNTALTLVEPWEGPTLTGVRYRIRYQWDSSRVSAQSRQLIEMLDNGNVLALAGLTGPGVPVFDGPHSMVIRPTQDFINGVAYDVQVDTLPDRAAYDGQAEGFAVLVSDVGDGRSALYSKASNTSGDWSDPAYITGPLGATPDIEATVTSTAPGTTPTVTPVPITGGTRLDFTLPEASGFYNAGIYDIGEAYTTDQVVRHNGSSFIALQEVPIGESPSNAFPPVDTAYWQVLATKGTDGTGTGDVVGPSGAVNNRIAVFDGTTGKLIKDGGVTVADVVPADGSITNAKLADMAQATIKGRASGAGTGTPADLNAAQAWGVLGVAPVANAYARSTILGTVTVSSGVPTGAVIERGSNANGEYVRFADGTQICWATFTRSVSTNTAETIVPARTWPAAFIAPPTPATTNGLYSNVPGVVNITSLSATTYVCYFFNLNLAAPGVNVGGSMTAHVIAKGRWF